MQRPRQFNSCRVCDGGDLKIYAVVRAFAVVEVHVLKNGFLYSSAELPFGGSSASSRTSSVVQDVLTSAETPFMDESGAHPDVSGYPP
jgi:hypothetical protein